jgi:hypothetical protein
LEKIVAIDDELEKSSVAADIREESERSVQALLVKSGLAGAISLVPLGVGSAMNEMLTQFAMRRTHERMAAMFDEMARHIRVLGEEKINREWFRGEEFQTLLFEALHQLHVTQDKQKIEMLGKALANSGAAEFKAEARKQLFLQLIRELTPQHTACLRRLLPPTEAKPHMPAALPASWFWQQRPHVFGQGDDLLILQMLAANGLVEETLKANEVREPSVSNITSQGDITRAIRSLLQDLEKPPLRYFCLSVLGMDFLKFVGSEPTNEQAEQPPVS